MKSRRLWGIVGYVVLGYAVTLLLVFAKEFVEHTGVGHEAELSAYRFLQGQLSPIDRGGLPVVVADITEVPGGQPGQPTPRDELRKIIAALVEKRPRAIALDIDFSPDEAGLRTQGDRAFFDYCLAVSRDQHIPIFLGVYNAQEYGPDTWLGLSQYAGMAASLDIPTDTSSRLPVSVRADGVEAPLPSLGAALAKAYREDFQGPPAWLRGALNADERDHPGVQPYRPHGSVFTYERVPINYSKLDQIIEGRREIRSAESVRDSIDRFTDKMVILGDGTRGYDQFNVHGRRQPVLGVFLHACVAYTLAREPLYEFKRGFRVALDLLISSAIIALVVWGRLWRPDEEKNHAWHRRQWKYILTAVILVIGGGVLLVRGLKVMWLDFFLVAVVLLLHTPVERKAHGLAEGLWRRVRGARGSADAAEEPSAVAEPAPAGARSGTEERV